MSTPYNPLDVKNLAHSVVTRLNETEATPLASIPAFLGAGVYAIYYCGNFDAYEPLAVLNQDGANVPIYIGKAVPKGGRRGLELYDSESMPPVRSLSDRLRQHARSIEAAENLNIEDFQARWLVVEDIWIPLGESAMIREHRPVWNAIVDGFGNHDPGKGRRAGMRPRWDTLHPGRPWALNFIQRPETPSQIKQEVQTYLRQRG